MPVDITNKYLRIRVKNPSAFKPSSFRTHDIGRKGHSMRIAGIQRSSGKWATQSWFISKKDLKEDDPRTFQLVRKIRLDLSEKDKKSVEKALRKLM